MVLPRGDEEDYPDEAEEQLVNEEYKIWKKNTPFLYGRHLIGMIAPSRSYILDQHPARLVWCHGRYHEHDRMQYAATAMPLLTKYTLVKACLYVRHVSILEMFERCVASLTRTVLNLSFYWPTRL